MPPEHGPAPPTRRATLTGALALAFGPAACGAPAPTGESAFQAFLADMTQAAIADSPERALARGAPMDIAPEAQRFGFDQRSPLAEELRRTAMLRWSAQLLGFAPGQLSAPERVTRAALSARFAATRACAGAPHGQLDLFSGYRPYAMSPGRAVAQTAPALLASMPLASLQDVEALVERFSRLPQALRDELAAARNDAAAGARLPASAAARLSASLAVETSVPGGRALATTRRALAALRATEDVSRLAFAAERIGADLARALGETAAAVPSLSSGEDAGLARLAGGRELYSAALWLTLGDPVEPDALRADAEAELAALSDRLDMALRGLGLAQGAVGERLAAVAATPDVALSPDALLRDAEAAARACATLSARLFAAPPKTWPKIALKADQAELIAYRPMRLDGAGAPEASMAAAPGYAATKLDAARAVASVWLGRHAPAERARVARALPLARHLAATPGWSEGIALYAETLAEEAGLFEADGPSRLGYLRGRMLAAALAAADVAAHWSGEAPLSIAARVASAAAITPAAALALVQGILIRPGRAAAAFHGRRSLETMREAARTRLGARFDIRGFHDLAMREGEIALETLRTLAAEWTT